MSKSRPFKKGDWIVHANYGVGQILAMETKILGDKETRYYKVEARNSTFFIPVENAENDRIRPVASRQKLRAAMKVLRQPPQDLDADHNARKRQIAEMASEFSPQGTAELVRDLAARRAERGLNDNEERTFELASLRLAREWAITEKMEFDEAQQKLDATLDEATAKVG